MAASKVPVELQPIHGSSNIAATGHDPDTNTLYVQFHSGKVWGYEGHDAAAHRRLRAAPSVGGHFHAHIKPSGGFEV
jgi:hypothetical protein